MIPFLKKKIYLTRSEEDNLNFQKCFNLLKPKLDTKKIFVSMPLLKICFLNIENLAISEKNLIFTSRYGVKAISEIALVIYCEMKYDITMDKISKKK